MSSISSQFAVVIAQTELKLVESVISAIRAGSAAAAQTAQPLGGGNPTPVPRQVFHPEPKFEPRQIIHPTPRYEPRPVIHLSPRVERQTSFDVPYDSVPHPMQSAPAFPPISHTLPWPTQIYCHPHFKREPPQPDMLVKGLLIDIFV